MSIIVYFASDEDTILRLGERAGPPGLDEDRDYFWAETENDILTFFPTLPEAVVNAVENKLPLVHEAKIYAEDAVKALNCAVNGNSLKMCFLVKEVLTMHGFEEKPQSISVK